MLERYSLSATFFIPAMTAILHPDMVPAIKDHGAHEIGIHGWVHESIVSLPEKEERELTRRAYDFWNERLDEPPCGIRTPSWDFSPATLSIIRELGLLYDSSLMADDRPYELMSDGQPTGVVELPVDWRLDDYMYFQIDHRRGYHPYISPNEVFTIWKEEFDAACEEGTLLMLTMHPQVIGHRSRLPMIARLIEYMREKPVWFATLTDIARYVRKTHGGVS
jgi:peptidoglycan/xylan/chitin deacetylase (PgdA/CDA1 family)